MQAIWENAPVEESNLTVCISKIRKLLGDNKQRNKYITTISGRGYCFIASVRKLPADLTDSIAVLPFHIVNTGPEIEYFADGLTDSLIYSLSALPSLKVTPRSSVFHYKNKRIDSARVAQRLGVRLLLLGRIAVRGQSIIISTELVDARTNELVWGKQYRRNMSSILATQSEIASEIINKLIVNVPVKPPIEGIDN